MQCYTQRQLGCQVYTITRAYVRASTLERVCTVQYREHASLGMRPCYLVCSAASTICCCLAASRSSLILFAAIMNKPIPSISIESKPYERTCMYE